MQKAESFWKARREPAPSICSRDPHDPRNAALDLISAAVAFPASSEAEWRLGSSEGDKPGSLRVCSQKQHLSFLIQREKVPRF